MLDPSHPEHSTFVRRATGVGLVAVGGLAIIAELLGITSHESLPKSDGTYNGVAYVKSGSHIRNAASMNDEKGDGTTSVIGTVPEGETYKVNNPPEFTVYTSTGSVTMIAASLPGSTRYAYFDLTDLTKQGKIDIVPNNNSANLYDGLASTKIENNIYMFQNSNGQYTQAGKTEILPAD